MIDDHEGLHIGAKMDGAEDILEGPNCKVEITNYGATIRACQHLKWTKKTENFISETRKECLAVFECYQCKKLMISNA